MPTRTVVEIHGPRDGWRHFKVGSTLELRDPLLLRRVPGWLGYGAIVVALILLCALLVGSLQ